MSDLSHRASFVARLLMNEMPDSIDEAFERLGLHLLPHSESDFTTHCSCPDWANPCKHIAGVYYLLAEDLDRDPFLMFELRGLSRQALRHQLLESDLGKILAAELEPKEVEIEPAASYYTVPTKREPEPMSYRQFWLGARRLPPFEPAPPARVPGLIAKKGGDFPEFWPKDASFLATMDELLARVRTRSPELR